MIQRTMTAEEFIEHRIDLPDGGQWAELVRGVPTSLEPPDIDHGTVVLNLSKAFAAYLQTGSTGYPCFDLGLKVESRPDTVFFPAASYFLEGSRFAEMDKQYTETRPGLVIELITTNSRRRQINERVGVYLDYGVRSIWLIDSPQRAAFVINAGTPGSRRITEFEILRGDPLLEGFSVSVADLFAEPEWAR